MSHNQSRVDKTEGHLRRPGRSGSFGQNKGFSGGVKGGGPSTTAPALSSSPAPPPASVSHEFSTNRSVKKFVNGGQGEPNRANPISSTFDAGNRDAPNGACAVTSSQGLSDGLEFANPKPVDSIGNKKNPRVAPKPPATSSAADNSGDESGPFLQFGTINPGIMNGMQVPARTCSAPPNLDEQKRDQVRHSSVKVPPSLPLPSAPKPQQAMQNPPPPQLPVLQQKQPQTAKDSGGYNQAGIRESYSIHAKRDLHGPVPSIPGAPSARSSVFTMGGMPMHAPFQQPQIPMQFSGHNLQMTSQGIVPSSLQMPMALPSGNVPQQLFVPNIQPSAIMHHGQSLAFTSQLGHQLPPQLGSMGVGIAPQFHQPGNFISQRRAVKITHPDTHEELKLAKRTDLPTEGSISVQRQLPNSTSQLHSLPPFNHQIGYYPTAFNPPSMFSSSLPMPSTQMTVGPQPARYGFSVGQNGQTISFLNPPSLNSTMGARSGPQPPLHGLAEPSHSEALPSTAPGQVTFKAALPPSLEKVGTPSVRISMPVTKPGSPKQPKVLVNASITPTQLKEKEVVSQIAATMLKKTSDAPLTDSCPASEKNLPRVSSMISGHIIKPEPASLDLNLIDSSSVEANKDGNKKESIRSESLNDHQGKVSKMEPKVDTLEDMGSRTLDSVKVLTGHNLIDDALEDSASIHLAPTVDSITSMASLHSVNIELSNSALDQTKKDLKGALGDAPGPKLEESLEDAGSNYCEPSQLANDSLSFEDVAHLEALASNIKSDGILPEASVDKISDCSVLGESLVKPISSVEGLSDENDQILEVSNKSDYNLCSNGDLVSSDISITTFFDNDKISAADSSIHKFETILSENVTGIEHNILLPEVAPLASDSETKHNPEDKTTKLSTPTQTVSVISGLPDKSFIEPNVTKTNRKKKMKEILSKADAAGSSDLYNAYKGPDQILGAVHTSETIETSLAVDSNNHNSENQNDFDATVELDEQSKEEIDDWEDAADASTSNLRSDNGESVNLERKMRAEYGNEPMGKKKYSKDFLLTFSEQYKDLPEAFEAGPDVADILYAQAGVTHRIDRDALPSPGRFMDRSPGSYRGDRRMAGISDDDKWMKGSNAFRVDLGHGVAAMNPRSAQGVNEGVLRNPRFQSPNQLSGGLLSGPMQPLASQGGAARNTSDADRWQRATGSHRGLIHPPQGSMHAMHKSANRYEVGKVSDEEEQKQRRLKAILNKLTPQNFEKLFGQVKEVNIDNTVTLIGVICQIFDKALMEPTFCEMYADFCSHLASVLPDFIEDDEKVTFRRLLLNKCQEEFERGEREEAEAEKVEEEGEIRQSDAEREVKRIQARRRMLGNIRLIGELYKKKMLTERIMHECIKKLLGQYQNPDEENIEALCKLMSTIGEMIDHFKAREHIDTYFEMLAKLSSNHKLSSRVRFMLKDTIDLRKNKWQQRRKVEGPKKIEDVHRDAAQERQAQTTRSARGPIISSKRGPPTDYGHRGPTILNSSSSQLTGSVRGLPGQHRGPGSQDARLDDRNQFEGRVLSSVLPQRHTDTGSITLGPQGGLAKGMSGRGQGLVSNVPSAEVSSRIGDSHKLAASHNGFSSTHDRVPSTSKRPNSSGGKISNTEPKDLSNETLREKSISAIREFYSAKDEKEIVLCIREMSTPSLYPLVVSHWVIDSFERKNMERVLLAKLLVNLSKNHDCLINKFQLIEGFESVLSELEDAVNDAPKAAEFLGHIIGEVVGENLISLGEIGKLIREGGEQPGALVEAGLGSEILGNMLEFVKLEKGDSTLNDIRTSSNLKLEDFRPSFISAKTKKLEAFLGR